MKFHCMNSVELILLKCIPRGHPNPCSRVGLSCSIFKNTSATCAYPLVSNARARHLLVHATFEKGHYEKYMFFRKYIRSKKHMFFEKVYIFLKSIYFLRKAPSRTP